MSIRLSVSLLTMIAACGSTDDATRHANPQTSQSAQTPAETPAETPAASVVDGFFSADGAPPPRACEQASDCLGDTIPDVDNPCCNNPQSLEPYSRAYRRWVGEWRAEECEGVECPPPPSPAVPPACSFQMQCVEGVCANEC